MNKRSLGEIAKMGGCSRQYVHKKIREFGIEVRTLGKARELALKGGKICYDAPRRGGVMKKIQLAHVEYDTTFFKTWTPQMAWVLGVIYTDGCIHNGCKPSPGEGKSTRTPELSIAQKEPELLQKVLALLKSNARMRFYERREFETTVAGEIYEIQLNASPIWEDLLRLGLHAKKSLTIRFPDEIPGDMVRHFIRGCWDGDGSVFEQADGRHVAHFVSGSEQFASGIVERLRAAGFRISNLYVSKASKNPVYYFKIFGEDCAGLFPYLYAGVPDSMALGRKKAGFENAFNRFFPDKLRKDPGTESLAIHDIR